MVEQGIHDFSAAYYAGDPCPEPSLTAAGIHDLLTMTPAHFAARHPRLTRWPNLWKSPGRAADFGTVVKALVLNKGHEIAVFDVEEFSTKGARLRRDQALGDGKIAIKRKEFEKAQIAAGVIEEQLRAAFGRWPLGNSDVSLVWQRPTVRDGAIWCRERVDHFGANVMIQFDTAAGYVNAEDIARKCANAAADYRALWFIDGWHRLYPDRDGIACHYMVMEVIPPFRLHGAGIEMQWGSQAQDEIETAVVYFAHHLRKDDWYEHAPTRLSLKRPEFAVREVRG